MKKLLLTMLAILMFSGITISSEIVGAEAIQDLVIDSGDILNDKCICSGQDSANLSRKLIKSSQEESEKFKTATALSLQSQIEQVLKKLSDQIDVSDFNSIVYVFTQGLGQVMFYMDDSSELYNKLNSIQLLFTSFDSQILTEQQKLDLQTRISENQPIVVDTLGQILSDLPQYARKNCVCKQTIQKTVLDLRKELEQLSEKVKAFKDKDSGFTTFEDFEKNFNKSSLPIDQEGVSESDMIQAAYSEFLANEASSKISVARDICNEFVTLVQNLSYNVFTAQESETLNNLLEYLRTLDFSISESAIVEEYQTKSNDLLQAYQDYSGIVSEILNKLQEALDRSDEDVLKQGNLTEETYLMLKEKHEKVTALVEEVRKRVYEK